MPEKFRDCKLTKYRIRYGKYDSGCNSKVLNVLYLQ